MQNIVNHSPFAAGKHLTKDGKTGEKIFIVAVKATFDIQDNGDLIIADEQKEVLDSPVYYGEESASSVQYPPDLYFQKPLVDLIVNGSAYAPPEEEVTEIQVSISVGDDWTKELRVIGDRYWKSEFGILKKTSPEFFSSIPVIYENAFGGVDQSEEEIPPEEQKNHPYNPVGTGFAIKKRYLEGLKLPNVEYVGSKTGKIPKKMIQPALAVWIVSGLPEVSMPEPMTMIGRKAVFPTTLRILIHCFTNGPRKISSLNHYLPEKQSLAII